MRTIKQIHLFSSVAAALTLALITSAAHAAKPTLYERIGGEAKMRAVVHEFVRAIEDDPRINFTFANTDLNKFSQLLFEQFCALTDGPCKYTGRDMKTSHEKLNISNAQLNALVEDLYVAFERTNVPYRLQNKLIVLLAPMQKDVVKR